ncbi:hypothetical protein [Falsirhodobacter sp. 20TX0035]|uniref:hypothetical protein n=1 Tax=Falsirhodobacter sp. 20TX0035 TaxID=3022019 RepID=UPI0023313D27|nr:hypothetical protein [Falsirhodobacter sp. 20TX0035]MDB6455130.1 hypothetical protein [Falsirhodobacter sp. 20TX0035]
MNVYVAYDPFWSDEMTAHVAPIRRSPNPIRKGLPLVEREAIFLRHHGLPVQRAALQSTDFAEWMRVVLYLARRSDPYMFDAVGSIRDQDRFTQWMAAAYPPKET